MIHADLRVKKCIAEFYLNDIPLRRLNSSFQGFYSEAAHIWLVDGINEVKVVVCPGTTPSRAQVPPPGDSVVSAPKDAEDEKTAKESEKEDTGGGGDKEASISIVQYPVGVFAGDESSGQLMMKAEWTSVQAPAPKFPCVVSESRDLDRMFGTWAWQKADRLDLEADMSEVKGAVMYIHRAFEDGDGKRIAEMARHYLEDIGRAIPAYGTKRFTMDMIMDINGNAGRKGWTMPIDCEEMDFRLCADGRLVQIIDRNWHPTIRTIPQPDGEIYPFPVLIGRIDGELQILL